MQTKCSTERFGTQAFIQHLGRTRHQCMLLHVTRDAYGARAHSLPHYNPGCIGLCRSKLSGMNLHCSVRVPALFRRSLPPALVHALLRACECADIKLSCRICVPTKQTSRMHPAITLALTPFLAPPCAPPDADRRVFQDQSARPAANHVGHVGAD